MGQSEEKKRVLVTGGSGYLGYFIARELGIDHKTAFTYASRRIQIPNCEAIHMELMRRDTIESALKEFQPHIVIHCAALADPSKCEKSHEIAREINVMGTKFLVQSLPDQDTLFIYISTDLVFNGENAPYDETTEPEPLTFYGKTKREGGNRCPAPLPQLYHCPILIDDWPGSLSRKRFIRAVGG